MYSLGLDEELGFGGYGDYGFDSIALSEQISVPSQAVGVVNITDYWLGFLGLSIIPTNFSNGAVPANSNDGFTAPNITSEDKKTFLSSMVETLGLIPSLSYGYTAGAYYRLKHVPSSLTLGGYDANKFQPHNVSFDLDPNLDPIVALNEITVHANPSPSSKASPGWASNSVTLLGLADVALYKIDSSTPYLWLPESVCGKFEKALGLTYNEDVRLYTFRSDSPQRDTLMNWNLTFDFVLADLPGSTKSVSVSLPYQAFDLQLTYPFPKLNATPYSPPTYYFPLRKAANDTQFTIGRAFLQETYLVVDYERNNFSVHQTIFAADASTNRNLVSIFPPSNSSLTKPGAGPSGKHGLSKGALIGIAVGAGTASSCVIGILVYVCICRRKAVSTADEKARRKSVNANESFRSKLGRWFSGGQNPDRPVEVEGNSRAIIEAPTDREIIELPITNPIELAGSEVEISPYEAAVRKFRMNTTSPVGHNPSMPVELQHHPSAEGFYGPKAIPDPDAELEANSPRLLALPPYSANHVGIRRNNTQTTGISSRSLRTSRGSSNLSSPMLISPLTPHHRSPTMPSMAHLAARDRWMLSNEGEESDYSDPDASYGSPHPDTPGSAGEAGPPDLIPSPLRTPRRFSSERQG